MSDEIPEIQGMSMGDQEIRTEKAEEKQELKNSEIRQEASKAAFKEWAAMGEFSPLLMSKKFKSLDEHLSKAPTESKQTAKKESPTKTPDAAAILKIAQSHAKSNVELQAKTLLLILTRLDDADTVDEILEKIIEVYKDHYLVDETLDFLLEASRGKDAQSNKIAHAKSIFNERYDREIRVGKNISIEARKFSKQGLGSPTALRDIYRDMTGNPREAPDLFDELNANFKFSQMNQVIDFILHSLGTDLKAKGPSISRPELNRLFSEARTMQAILGLYRFFQKRMTMIQKQFDMEDLPWPPKVTFEYLAKILMKLLKERYPNGNKVLQLASYFGISEEVAAQIILFSQYRDSMRHLSPKLFKSERHRQDTLLAILDGLSDLEDMLEEEDEEEDEDDEFPTPRNQKDTLE